jgi:CRP-like cAMP-binding protein
MTDSGKTGDLASQGSLANRRDQMFPKLSAAQLARLQRYGQRRALRAGEILAEPGDRGLPMWVVLSGSIEAVQMGMAGETTGGDSHRRRVQRRDEHAARDQHHGSHARG